MRLIYNTDSLHDVISVLRFIDSYTLSLGVQALAIDSDMVQTVVNTCKSEPFPHHGGIAKASAFKQVANFVCFFVAMRPIPDPFPVEVVGPDLVKIGNHQNAMVAFALAEAALYKSTIKRKDGPITIDHPIEYSRHSYIDIIEALANISHVAHFHMLTVLLEQMVYKTNPKCQYPIISGPK